MREKESFRRILQLTLAGICLLMEVWVYNYLWSNYISYEMKAEIGVTYWFWGNKVIVGVYGLLLLAFAQMYGGIKIGYYRNSEIIFSQLFATVLVNIFTYFQDSLILIRLVNPKYFLSITAVDALIIIGWNFVASYIYKCIFLPRKMLLIHGDRPYKDIVAKFNSRKDKYDICKCISYRRGYDAIFHEIPERYDAIVIWDIPVDVRNKILKFCYGRSIRVYIMPKITDVILKGAAQLYLFDTPILYTREYKLSIEQRFMKRLIDIVCSLLLIIISSPFMLLTAIAVKLYDGGPVLYKQTRCTIGGKEFRIMKFRSMGVDAEKDGVARLASKNDARVTPVGKVIRVCRLDELPQLFNILKGEMSFIGPRPERPEIISQYMEVMPEFQFRMRVKAGLAGYAQVYGKYNTTPYDKLKLDLYYIENYSLWMDIKLMFLTLKILLTPDSTEGIEASQITAMKQSNKELLEKRARLDAETRERVEREQRERAAHEAEVLERQKAEQGMGIPEGQKAEQKESLPKEQKTECGEE